MKVVLASGKVIEDVDASVLRRSDKLKTMLRGGVEDDTLQLNGVDLGDEAWDKAYEWLLHHKDSTPSFEMKNGTYSNGSTDPKKVVINAWEATYLEMPNSLLLKMMHAANVLKIQPLLSLTCKGFYNIIVGMSPAEIRETFGIINDFTPEEEEAARAEDQRAIDSLELAARLGQVRLRKKKRTTTRTRCR